MYALIIFVVCWNISNTTEDSLFSNEVGPCCMKIMTSGQKKCFVYILTHKDSELSLQI